MRPDVPLLSGAIEMNAHHGDEENAIRRRFLEQLEGRAQRNYSHGRVGPDDDGDLAMAIGHDAAKGIVVIDYGKMIQWVGMPAEQAVKMAEMLIEHAVAVGTGPLSISIGGTIRNLPRPGNVGKR